MFSIDEIKSLMDKMQETNLGELKLKNDDFELKLKAKNSDAPQIVNISAPTQASEPSIQSPFASAGVAKEEVCGNVIKSPIVGTFYSAAAPDRPPFVTVGSRVKKGDVLFVIESMKLMNEIQSEFDGEVISISVDNAQPVEFNQTIMIIK